MSSPSPAEDVSNTKKVTNATAADEDPSAIIKLNSSNNDTSVTTNNNNQNTSATNNNKSAETIVVAGSDDDDGILPPPSTSHQRDQEGVDDDDNEKQQQSPSPSPSPATSLPNQTRTESSTGQKAEDDEDESPQPLRTQPPRPSPSPEQNNNNTSSTSVPSGSARKGSVTAITTTKEPQPRPPMSFGTLATPKPGAKKPSTAIRSQTPQSPTKTTNTRTNVTTVLPTTSTTGAPGTSITLKPTSSFAGPTSRKTSPSPTVNNNNNLRMNNNNNPNRKSTSPTNVVMNDTEHSSSSSPDTNNNNKVALVNNNRASSHSPVVQGSNTNNTKVVSPNHNNSNAGGTTTTALTTMMPSKSRIDPAPSTAFMMSSSPAITTTSRGQRPSSFSNYTIQFVKDHQSQSAPVSSHQKDNSNNKKKANTNNKQTASSFFIETGVVPNVNLNGTTSQQQSQQQQGGNNSGTTTNTNANNNANINNPRITIRALQVIDDNNTVWAAEKDGRISIFDSKTGVMKRRFERRNEYFPICMTYVAPFVWIGFNDGVVRVFDVDTVACMKEAKEHSGQVNCFEAPVYGQRLHSEVFSGGADFMIVRWNSATVERMSVINAHSGPIRCLSWFSHCDVLICGGDDGSLKAWTISPKPAEGNDTTTDKQQKEQQQPHNQEYFQPTSAISYQQQQQEASGLLASVDAHRQGVLCTTVCQHYIWSGGSDGSVKIWEIDLVAPENNNSNEDRKGETTNNEDKTVESTLQQQQQQAPASPPATTATLKLVHEIKAPHTHAVSKLIRVADTVWSVCLGSIFVWSGETFDELTRYVGEHTGYITSASVVREAAVSRLWTAGAEGGFFVWNSESDLVPAARLSSYSFMQLASMADYSGHRFGMNLVSAGSKARKTSPNNKIITEVGNAKKKQAAASPKLVSTGTQMEIINVDEDEKSVVKNQEEDGVIYNNTNKERSVSAIEREDDSPVNEEYGTQSSKEERKYAQQQQRRGSSCKNIQSNNEVYSSRKLPPKKNNNSNNNKTSSATASRSNSRAPADSRGGSVQQQEQQDSKSSIRESRDLLRQHGIPTDETWRTLLCSTIFSTRLDAESIVKNYYSYYSSQQQQPPQDESSISTIDVTSFQSIMASLNFLSEEQQQRLFDLAKKTHGVKYLHELVFRSIDGENADNNDEKIQIPPSALSLNDWAFVNRIWLALNRRTHIISVVQNEGVTAIAPDTFDSTTTDETTDTNKILDDSNFGMTIVPTKIESKSESSSNNKDDNNTPTTVSLSGAIEGVTKERRAFSSDDEIFSSDQSTAQFYNWLEKQRQSILESLRVVSSNGKKVGDSSSAIDDEQTKEDEVENSSSLMVENLILQEEKERQEIRADCQDSFISELLLSYYQEKKSSSSTTTVTEDRAIDSENAQEEQQMTTEKRQTEQESQQQQQQQQQSVSASGEEQQQQQQQQEETGANSSSSHQQQQKEEETVAHQSSSSTNNTKIVQQQQQQQQQPKITYVDPSKLSADEKADIEDICVSISTTSQVLIAQHRQSHRATMVKYSEDFDNASATLNFLNEKLNTQQEELSQSKKDMIQKTKELHKLSLALGEMVNDNTRLKKIIEESEDASNFELLTEQLEKSHQEVESMKDEITRLRRIEAEINDQRFQQENSNNNGDFADNVSSSTQQQDGGEIHFGGGSSPSPVAQQRGNNNNNNNNHNYSVSSNYRGSDGLPHSDRCRWLSSMVSQEIEKRPQKEEQHRNLLQEMERLEVTMKEKQDSSVVRQRHAAKTLSVDLATAEVSREVALEMVRLLRTRVEFFEERDSQWSRLSELLGDVARMHIDSFVFSESFEELQRASRELSAVLDLRGTIGKANAEIFRLLGDVMKSLNDFRVFTENRPPTRGQMLDFVEKTENRIGVTREGIKWILSNFFSEPELLHLGFSPTIFVPDEKRVKAPIPPSLMVLMSKNNQNQNVKSPSTRNTTSSNALVDPWVESEEYHYQQQQQMMTNNNSNTNVSNAGSNTMTNSHGGQIMMRERDQYQPQPAVHGQLAAPMKSKDVQ